MWSVTRCRPCAGLCRLAGPQGLIPPTCTSAQINSNWDERWPKIDASCKLPLSLLDTRLLRETRTSKWTLGTPWVRHKCPLSFIGQPYLEGFCRAVLRGIEQYWRCRLTLEFPICHALICAEHAIGIRCLGVLSVNRGLFQQM